jgi:hypothetical protein
MPNSSKTIRQGGGTMIYLALLWFGVAWMIVMIVLFIMVITGFGVEIGKTRMGVSWHKKIIDPEDLESMRSAKVFLKIGLYGMVILHMFAALAKYIGF